MAVRKDALLQHVCTTEAALADQHSLTAQLQVDMDWEQAKNQVQSGLVASHKAEAFASTAVTERVRKKATIDRGRLHRLLRVATEEAAALAVKLDA